MLIGCFVLVWCVCGSVVLLCWVCGVMLRLCCIGVWLWCSVAFMVACVCWCVAFDVCGVFDCVAVVCGFVLRCLLRVVLVLIVSCVGVMLLCVGVVFVCVLWYVVVCCDVLLCVSV